MNGELTIDRLDVLGAGSRGGWTKIVDHANLTVKRGEIVSLIGESGAGKSTVALSALGYFRPGTRRTAGGVYLDGFDLLTATPEQIREIRGRRVAYVAQSAAAALNPRIPLGSQIVEAMAVHGFKDANKRYQQMLDLLGIMQLPNPETFERRYSSQISGGQRQRVMMAMAMACDPEFLILDEPTTALDVTTQVEVLKAIGDVIRLKDSGAIYVSHDISVVAQVSDWIIVMNGGKMVDQAATADLLSHPTESYTKQLISAVRTVPKTFCDYGSGIEEEKHDADDPLLRIRGVSATYDRSLFWKPVPEDHHVLRRVDVDIRRGQVVSLVGESGSGKSTLARVISGLTPAIAGTIEFEGRVIPSVVGSRPLDLVRRIQMVFQSPDMTLNPARTVEDAIARPLELYFGMTGTKRSLRVKELLDLVELPSDFGTRYPAELSGGQKQRVALARAFAAESDLIICDEILASLDNLVAAKILSLLKDLKDRLGVTYLFVSHDLATVAQISDWVVVLYGGRVCEAGTAKDVFSPPFHPYTSLLLSSVPELRPDWLRNLLLSRLDTDSIGASMFPVDIGCAFRNRCPDVLKDRCRVETPPVRTEPCRKHAIYCHRSLEYLHGGE